MWLKSIGSMPQKHTTKRDLGAVSVKRCILTSKGISMWKIRQPRDRLIFNMGIPIPEKDGLYIESEPCVHFSWDEWLSVVQKPRQITHIGVFIYDFDSTYRLRGASGLSWRLSPYARPSRLWWPGSDLPTPAMSTEGTGWHQGTVCSGCCQW